ncbi:hypothetical protein [Undibacterium rivi]|nr:hypothetical protein [Undibacterium rivi]
MAAHFSLSFASDVPTEGNGRQIDRAVKYLRTSSAAGAAPTVSVW